MPAMSVPTTNRSWQCGVRRAGDGVDRGVRVPGGQGQHFERVPAGQPLGRGEPGLTPVVVDLRVTGAAADSDRAQRGPDGRRDGRRPQAGYQDPAAGVHQAGHRAGQHRGRVAQHAAPVTGVIGALAQRHPQREHRRAARAEEDGRPRGRHPRPVRGDQHVRGQVRGVPGTEFPQPRRPGFLARLDQDHQVEAEPPAPRAQHLLQRGQVDGVLALVIGRSPAVPAILLHRDPPRVKPGPPAVLLGQHHIGVTVGQHRRQPGRLRPARDQQRPAAGIRVVQDPGRGAEPGRRRNHFLLQVRQQVRAPGGQPAFGPEPHPAGKIGPEGTRVEIVSRLSNSHGPGHQPSRPPRPAAGKPRPAGARPGWPRGAWPPRDARSDDAAYAGRSAMIFRRSPKVLAVSAAVIRSSSSACVSRPSA